MSTTGSLFQITALELNQQIDHKFAAVWELPAKADLSYFILDLPNILRDYSGLSREAVGKILEGCHAYQPQDGYVGYMYPEEVKQVKAEILDRISVEDFKGYLERGEQEGHAHCEAGAAEFLIPYFTNIKNAYADAVAANEALIFCIG